MARIVLDPDDVNQGDVFTLTDGTTVEIATAERAPLGRVSRQLARYASVYEAAYRAPDLRTAERIDAGTLTVAELAPLHIAVARRHAALKDQPGRGAQDVDPTALLDDHRWTTGGGIVKRLDELTPSHRRNLLSWLERNDEPLQAAARAQLSPADLARITPADPWVAGTPVHKALTALDQSTDSRELAMDQARQTARRIAFQTTGRWPTE